MFKRVAVMTGIAVLVTGGLIAAGRWRDNQLSACERRSGELAALDLLAQRPAGFQADEPYAGCDQDRIIAYAGRQFVAATGPGSDQLVGRATTQLDETAVRTFYRSVLQAGDWKIFTSTAAPGQDTLALCAGKELSFGTARVSLSFPVTGMYELHVADTADSGPGCG